MSEYKKKRSSNIRVMKKTKQTYSDEYDKIELKPKTKNTTKHNKKQPKKFNYSKKSKLDKFFLLFSVLVILFVTYLIIYLSHPTGVFEYIGHIYKSIGSGSGYEIFIEGGRPIYTVSADNKYFTVNATNANIYNKNGKLINNIQHNFTDPVLKNGDTRYLLYGQGDKELWVSTLSEIKYKLVLNKGIICSAISKNGTYAVATKADGYESSVSVYNKNNKKIFEWFSTDSTINNIAVSSNGKLIAVSTLMVDGGKFVSKIHILTLKSANPIYTNVYDNQVVYQLETTSSNYFCATFEDNIEFINFKNGKTVKYQSDYSLSIFKKVGNKIAVVRTTAANREESIIEIYGTRGRQISKFEINKHIKDISYKNSFVYLLDLSNISKYDLRGKLHTTVTADYDSANIEVLSNDNVACINNSSIDKYKLTTIKE